MKAIRLFLTLSFSLITILSSTYVTGGNAPAPVAAHDDGTVYILAIGNSFTDDSVRDYFHGFTNADGKKVVVGFMYIPGCSLERHLTNAREDKPDYEFWKSDTEGNYSSTKSSRLSEVIPSERWDYIVFQQQSGLSGVYQSYEESLPELVEYTKGLAANPDVTYVFHMTWAYASDFGSERFGRYGYDQLRMYNAITDATYRGVRLVGINLIIPSGTAIQNGRTSPVGDNFCRDGYHLHHGIGRFTAAATWYAALFGKVASDNTYNPANLTPIDIAIGKKAADYAVSRPFEITAMDSAAYPAAYRVPVAVPSARQ